VRAHDGAALVDAKARTPAPREGRVDPRQFQEVMVAVAEYADAKEFRRCSVLEYE
jgi:hypothetical protein